jgi:hypothetical protein
MKTTIAFVAVLVTLGSASMLAPAWADADDVAWVNKCVRDNQKEGATADVTKKWCTCMNEKMSSSETLSISAWEKNHPTEVAACDKDSGWK